MLTSVFVPELRGEWGFTMVPGIRMPDGTINRAVSVAGTVAAHLVHCGD